MNFSPFQTHRCPPIELTRELLRFIESQAPESTAPPSWRQPALEDFEKAFARVQNLISQGQIEKAVPVVFARAEWEITAVRKAKLLLEALRAPQPLWPMGFWDAEEGLIGATPEVLFHAKGRELRTMALAGTLARDEGREQDLLRSRKDLEEHRLVVEDLRRELQAFGHVVVGETGVLELPSLWHLKTDLQVHLHEPADERALIKALHPTAALGVFPRRFGWRWLRELPGQNDRARFGAPLTFRLGPDEVISLVAIRHLQWQNSSVSLGSGCGVVRDSEPRTEWNELLRKRESVLRLLGLMT